MELSSLDGLYHKNWDYILINSNSLTERIVGVVVSMHSCCFQALGKLRQFAACSGCSIPIASRGAFHRIVADACTTAFG